MRNRKVAAHRLNEHSSRSHGMMTVYVESEMIDTDDQRVIRRRGKLCFVDLAGSESVKESGAVGDTLTETLNINKSLLTLGICISALADMKKKKTATMHIPYRDSKLTKLLSDSLGGSGMTLMIACISPASHNLHETLNTLRYASRAKRIQNRPVVQIDSREALIMGLKNQIRAAQEENLQLRMVLHDLGHPDFAIVVDHTGSAVKSISAPSSLRSAPPGHVVRSLPPPSQQPSSSPDNSTIPSLPSIAPQSSSPVPSAEFDHTKQMLNKFIEENQTLKSENVSLTHSKHQLTRENRELLEENERLVGKMEKLMQIYGTNLDSEISKFTSSASITPTITTDTTVNGSSRTEKSPGIPSNPAAIVNNTRLFLMSKRGKSIDEQSKSPAAPPAPTATPVPTEPVIPTLDATTKKRSTKQDVLKVASSIFTRTNSNQQADLLKQDLAKLDAELEKLSSQSATKP